jgi:hypothetical protein
MLAPTRLQQLVEEDKTTVRLLLRLTPRANDLPFTEKVRLCRFSWLVATYLKISAVPFCNFLGSNFSNSSVMRSALSNSLCVSAPRGPPVGQGITVALMAAMEAASLSSSR